jgi:hypothetical protein
MNWFLIIVAALAELLGLVWLLQGLSVLGGSRMTGDPMWAVIGAILLVVGTAMLVILVRRNAGRAT